MSNGNLCVEKVIYYHIERGSQWSIGETRFVGREKNNFMKYYDVENITMQDPTCNKYYGINQIAGGMIQYINNNQKPPFLASFYHFDANQTVKELNDALCTYLRLVREFIFEEVRKEFFPNLPSREKCMWVIPNNIQALKYWWDTLGRNGQIVKLELAGKIHQANQQYLELNTNSLDYLRMQAFKYWSATSGTNPIEEECLFEGFATAIDIVDPNKLGI